MKTKSFEQVQEDALFLSQEDRLRLVHLLVDDLGNEPDEVLDENEARQIEAALQERLDGPFVPVRDIKEWTDGIRARFKRRTEALIESGKHG